MVWRGVAWCDVCGVVCCSSFFFSFILFRRRSKKVALPVHLLRQVFILGFFAFFSVVFSSSFLERFLLDFDAQTARKSGPKSRFFRFLGDTPSTSFFGWSKIKKSVFRLDETLILKD